MSQKLRVVIADDERPARSFLAALLRGFEDVELVGEATTGTEAIELIEERHPDLALLDLQMPELDGLSVVRLLKKSRLPLIVFVTAYDEYAVRAFELNAVDYLLKPVEAVRLREAIKRAQDRLEYYGGTGPLRHPLPGDEQVHQLYPGGDLMLTDNIVWNFGVGIGATPTGNRLVYKSRIGILFGKKE